MKIKVKLLDYRANFSQATFERSQTTEVTQERPLDLVHPDTEPQVTHGRSQEEFISRRTKKNSSDSSFLLVISRFEGVQSFEISKGI